ncbi:hypothetical protein [Mycoplasma sp. HF3V]|uniref:hypothetical protein n=1 Tax=Mycoplasma sp. HF3V TaxID=3401694 RepID=UPI003AB10145
MNPLISRFTVCLAELSLDEINKVTSKVVLTAFGLKLSTVTSNKSLCWFCGSIVTLICSLVTSLAYFSALFSTSKVMPWAKSLMYLFAINAFKSDSAMLNPDKFLNFFVSEITWLFSLL